MIQGRTTPAAVLLPATLLAVVAAGAVSVVLPSLLPWSLVAVALAAAVWALSARGDLAPWPFVWVLSYGVLAWPIWRAEVPGFFNLTIPRLIFLAMLAAFGVWMLARGARPRLGGLLGAAMLALLVYLAANATAFGWVSAGQGELTGSPYFRYLAAFVFPFAAFFLLYTAAPDERGVRRVLILLSVFAWYALYCGYLQYAANLGLESARSLLFPSYIADPEFGIHFNRGRGPFPSSGEQAVLLTVVFFADLYLLRHVRGLWRPLLWAQAVMIPPGIFFTGLRAGYVAFLLAGLVWCLTACRGRFVKSRLSLALVVLVVLSAVFWDRLAGTDRAAGGVAQVQPIQSRRVLAVLGWEMFKDAPAWGQGFGHFLDATGRVRTDPALLGLISVGVGTPHNVLLVMLCETGLVGVGLILSVWGLLAARTVRLYRRLPVGSPRWLSRPLVALLWVTMAAWLTDAMFTDPFWAPVNNGLLWSMAGLVLGCGRALETGSAALPPAAAA
jgi:hypothetical protein